MFSIEHGLEQQKMRKIVELNVFILETVILSGSNKLPSVQVCIKLFQPKFNGKCLQFLNTIFQYRLHVGNFKPTDRRILAEQFQKS